MKPLFYTLLYLIAFQVDVASAMALGRGEAELLMGRITGGVK